MNQPFDTKCAQLDDLLGVGRSFDMVSRELYVGGRRAKMRVVNGYAKDMLLERAVEKLQEVETLDGISGVDELLRRYITVCDAGTSRDRMQAVTDVFAGKTLLIIDGFSGGILLDAKTFPTRSVQEPDAGKVLRGSHDGFVESIMENAALLRRIDLRSVSMSQETIAEAIAPKQWYNPFPKVRYTERPDVATASVMEGDILVLIDNTPVVMLLPVSLLRFNEEINDYYFPPLVGTYLRIIRFFVMLLNVVITPLWYLLATEPGGLQEPWDFLLVEGEYAVPLVLQLLLVELIIDVLKLASLNTPDVLGNSFSMLGALILGDFAVQSRWLVPEVLVYMAFVAVSNFAQHSFEMGYACKLCRMALVLLAFALRWWGFGIGLLGVLALMATTKPIAGRGYLYPLIPWNGKALRSLLLRRPAHKDNT